MNPSQPRRLPDDPAAFIGAAERITNAFDVDGAIRVYAKDAHLESLTDGVRESYLGIERITYAWRVYMAALQRGGLRLSKRLIVASGDTIVNDWRGALSRRSTSWNASWGERGRSSPDPPAGGRSMALLANGSEARGMECWRFDEQARVREHTMFSYLDVKESTDPLARLRMLASYPRMALAFFRAQRRAG